jgi:predicted nucleic acid-binding protein
MKGDKLFVDTNILLSEDLSDSQAIGSLQIRNPF